MEGKCADCSDVLTKDIPVVGEHKYTWEIESDSTCSANGKKKGVCVWCGNEQTVDLPLTDKHDYLWEITVVATCEEDGKAEGVCDACGDKQTIVIASKGHNYVENICTECGKDKTKTYLAKGQKIGYTLDEIYDKGKAKIYADNKEEFVQDLSTTNILNIFVGDNLFNVVFEYEGKEISASVGIDKVDYNLQEGLTDNISSIEIEEISNGTFVLGVIHANGEKIVAGIILGAANNNNLGIKYLAINKNNELLVVYNDNSVEKFGTVPTTPLTISDSVLIYEKIDNGTAYKVVGCFNRNIENLVIPATHKGVPVTKVGVEAFKNYENLKTVTFGENIVQVGVRAFSGCSQLHTVTINKALTYIANEVFNYDTKLKTVYFKGTKEQFNKISVGYFNDYFKISDVIYS